MASIFISPQQKAGANAPKKVPKKPKKRAEGKKDRSNKKSKNGKVNDKIKERSPTVEDWVSFSTILLWVLKS